MVASNILELPYYKGIGRRRGRGFGARALVILRIAILFWQKYVFPAAKRVGADLLENAVPDVADVVSGKKKLKTAANEGRQTLIIEPGGGRQKKSIPVKNLERSSWSRRDIFTNIEI